MKRAHDQRVSSVRLTNFLWPLRVIILPHSSIRHLTEVAPSAHGAAADPKRLFTNAAFGRPEGEV